ncbi:MAG: hypothetical protein OQL09_05020 [Gammaproteobacteria bacterium]|nr:hypothetical protein [Gammaproteobacteria bacterium]
MSNRVTASIMFYFKGKQFAPSCEFDLDTFMQTDGHLPNFYTLLANTNNINLYSYEFEMMQTETIIFNQPQGLIADYIHDSILDIEGFEAAWHKQKIDKGLQNIARRYMSIEQLSQHPDLEAALQAAYQLGKTAKD